MLTDAAYVPHDGLAKRHVYTLTILNMAITIIVAVLCLVDIKCRCAIWRNSKPEFMAMAATTAVTLLVGVEPGVNAGVGLSLALFLWRASRPHAAIVGRIPEIERFRNVNRHRVFTDLRHLIPMCSVTNGVDVSALGSIGDISHRLADGRVKLRLSEVKCPVTDALHKSHLPDDLTEKVWLSQKKRFRGSSARQTMMTPRSHGPIIGTTRVDMTAHILSHHRLQPDAPYLQLLPFNMKPSASTIAYQKERS